MQGRRKQGGDGGDEAPRPQPTWRCRRPRGRKNESSSWPMKIISSSCWSFACDRDIRRRNQLWTWSRVVVDSPGGSLLVPTASGWGSSPPPPAPWSDVKICSVTVLSQKAQDNLKCMICLRSTVCHVKCSKSDLGRSTRLAGLCSVHYLLT